MPRPSLRRVTSIGNKLRTRSEWILIGVKAMIRSLSGFARHVNDQFKSGAWDESCLLALMFIGTATVAGAVLVCTLLGIFVDTNTGG